VQNIQKDKNRNKNIRYTFVYFNLVYLFFLGGGRLEASTILWREIQTKEERHQEANLIR
jgi:hypothetical protein